LLRHCLMYGLSIVFADNGELIELVDNGVKGDVLCMLIYCTVVVSYICSPAETAKIVTPGQARLSSCRTEPIYKPNKESRCSEITTLIASE